MANWSNARLLVVGPRAWLLAFSRCASRTPHRLFRADMLSGETQNLYAERMCCEIGRCAQKSFIFQIRSDDGRAHFRGISREFKALFFILTYADPNCDDYGSFLIHRGRSRSYRVPAVSKQRIMAKHGAESDLDDNDDWRFWEATWDLMDFAESRFRLMRRSDMSRLFAERATNGEQK